MERLKALIQYVATRILSDVLPKDMKRLIFPGLHPPLLALRRAEVIISRVRLVAVLFAVLTPLWIVVDLLAFPSSVSLLLAAGRITTSIAFGVLAFSYRSSSQIRDAYRALALMFAIPTLFFLYSHPLLSHYQMAGFSGAIAAGYAFLPFVMLAGLSVFPLTALEGVTFSLPILLAEAIVAVMQLDMLNWSSHLGAFWLLVLIAVVATLSGMSQLSFMMTLVQQASHDPLTGCFRRATGEEILDIQFRIASRSGDPFAVVFLDLDNFKPINDQFGHEAGDQMLIAAVESIHKSLRGEDILVRWGGEEFLVILSRSDCTAAIHAVNRWRALGLGTRPDGAPLTASYGIAERLADRVKGWKELLDIADRRMYEAKRGGKNGYVAYSKP